MMYRRTVRGRDLQAAGDLLGIELPVHLKELDQGEQAADGQIHIRQYIGRILSLLPCSITAMMNWNALQDLARERSRDMIDDANHSRRHRAPRAGSAGFGGGRSSTVDPRC